MPEGPETKYLVNWLNKDLLNKKLNNIKINGGRYKKHGPPTNFDKLIFPITIEKIDCHGKFIYWIFKDIDIVLFNTLGMTGWYQYDKDKHNNIEFIFSDFSIYFNDYRNFGTFIFCYKDNLNKKLITLGPDILNEKDNSNEFINRINRKRKNTTIGAAIMDQKVSAGVGNYIRAESLYLAKLDPFKQIKDISTEKLLELWDILKQIGWFYYDEKKGKKLNIINNKYKLYNLYKKKGPSKYKRGQGFFLVYQQKKDPLGNPVTTDKINDRTIHYVKNIQF
uniref:DNA-(apurinic or apyrimidinic site) lyase n=1 Tax=Megaviridae environmental sample TaxID=1737588 RepID=A0A5J6VKY8_9VIRU|nr:MAG: formamidopyrimidine-DNA glycosylase H2TH domain [Megaviridae environmental sample]